MAKPLIHFFILFVVFILAGCSSSPRSEAVKLPDWVSHPEAKYSAERYLYAVGSGGDRNSAILDARRELAQSVFVKVSSQISSRATSDLNQSTDGQVSGQATDAVSKNLTTSTDTALRGAEVKEAEKVGEEFYVLVVMDKLKARSGLMLENSRVQKKLEGLISQYRSNPSGKKMKELNLAYQEAEKLNAESTLFQVTGLLQTGSLAQEIDSIRAQRSKAWASKSFQVSINKPSFEYVKDQLEECLSEMGAKVIDGDHAKSILIDAVGAPGETYALELVVQSSDAHQKIEGFQKKRVDLAMSAIKGKEKFKKNFEAAETARTGADAERAAMAQVTKQACEYLGDQE